MIRTVAGLLLCSVLVRAQSGPAAEAKPLRLAIAGLVHGHVSGFLQGARPRKDVEIAESMVIDHLLGWRSIVSTYEAIFAFDLTEAMRRIAAPTLILEMQTSDEAHFGAQSPALCAMMKRAQSIVLPDTDASVFRIRPDVIADAVTPFLAAR